MARRGAWPPAPEPLPSPVVDNHCHLESPAGDEPRSVEDRLAEAAAVGVDRVVQIGCELEAARWTADAVVRYPQMLGGISLHPNEAPLHAKGEHPSGVGYAEAFAEIARLAQGERIRIISETGLDYHWTDEPDRPAQVQAFRDHIALAKELGLPVGIHDRDAHADVLDVLQRDGAPDVTVFHCFSGDAAMARLCVDRGYYLSFAGNLTFKNATDLRAALAVTPLSRVMVETDSPYLTPHPHRGAPNSPALVAHTVREVARVKDIPLAQACEALDVTTVTLYGPW
ncbi:TatD family hydrolase [Demequina capsici]|uniref:TatD family hydrolase n=1 Tax=Demequina capsici TaxID=3075620 RepID=A0AA96FE41_9MICO|nr:MULTISPECIES: TatD family hydrolase [unclassified Demequina]WNM25026.1 TatD family hydrolase [Demequina sp. OYTSA14]WNM27932.1 TatD family hydrolase [Demequina sp. PMTSA13]